MEPDRCLAGARSALHGEQLVERGTDDIVLLGLDGGDDVEHLAGAGALELGQQGIPASQARGRGIAAAARSTEEVVGHGDDGVAVHHDLAPPRQPEVVLGTGPVEGDSNGCPPVDHYRVRPDVLDVAPPDVPRRSRLVVDASEEEGPGAVGQQTHPSRQGGDVVKVGVSCSDQLVSQLFSPFPHGRQRSERVVEIGLLVFELAIGVGGGHGHLVRAPGKSRVKADAQKAPDMPGIVLHFGSHYKASTWKFPFSSVRTLNL